MNQSESVIEVAAHERKTRVLRLQRNVERVLKGLIGIEINDIAAMRHHIAHPHFIEFEGIDQNFAFNLGDLLIPLALLHQIDQLLRTVRVTVFINRLNTKQIFQQPIRSTVHQVNRQRKCLGEQLQGTG